ncbi:MAG: helix-turn-helix domain-containing protein [Burkholderiaceae bacterium]
MPPRVDLKPAPSLRLRQIATGQLRKIGSSEHIRALRDRLKLSQAVLATVLNTSLSTVRQWEIGEKHPSGPSLKLLHLLDRKGLDALI